MQLTDAITTYLGEQHQRARQPETIQGYKSQLHLLRDYLHDHHVEQLTDITPQLLDGYIADLRTRENLQRGGALSPVTIKKRAMFLKQFFNWCHKRGHLPANIAANLELPKAGRRLPKVIIKADLTKLFDLTQWRKKQLTRDRALLMLMFDSGLRLAELCALDLADLNLDACIVHVRTGKWDQERYSVFTHATADALRAWLDERHQNGSDAAFLNEDGERLTHDGMYKIVKRRGKQTGVKLSPHRARHTFVTYTLENGASLATVQQLAGHSDPRTTANYYWVALDHTQRAHEKYSPLREILQNGEPE